MSTAPVLLRSRRSGAVVPLIDDQPEYRTGFLEPGSLHPDAILPCEGCAGDVTEGRIRYRFPMGSGFRGTIYHEVCFQRADSARLRRLLAAGLRAEVTL